MSDGKQIDLFLESILDAPVKDERALMEFPFFALTKQPKMDAFIYDDGQVKISVEPGPGGMATIWDKDILIYCASLVNERIERGAPVDRTMQISAYDFLKLTGRGTGKRGYELMLDALDRLQATTIRTTITSGHEDERERRGFSWLDSYRVVEKKTKDGRKIMAAVEITINKWMWRALVEDRRVLSIDRAYFRLTKGLERRLYELARKHCGSQQRWQIRMERLANKCGSTRALRNFKRELKVIIERDSLPSYRMSLAFDKTSSMKRAIENMGGDTARWGENRRILVIFEPRFGTSRAE